MASNTDHRRIREKNEDSHGVDADDPTVPGAANRRPGRRAQASRAAAKSKEIADLKSRFEKVRKAKETLTSNPDDPAAIFRQKTSVDKIAGLRLRLLTGKVTFDQIRLRRRE